MGNKVIRIPISYDQRKKNEKGPGYVPCQISGRYLYFDMESCILKGGEFISVNVMTSDTNKDKDRLLTRIIVKKKDLLGVLNNVRPREFTE
ncbi:MAG TPA: hypothetical protein VFC98_03130 [Clostridia bacterium]|nr:hypothetical protein [Clostridia bacterium]